MNEIALNEISKRLFVVNGIVKKLDVAIRQQAFSLLEDYILGEPISSNAQGPGIKPELGERTEGGDFFTKHLHDKPSENALLLSAFHFKEYGDAPFTVAEMETLAAKVGVTIPDRLDKTLCQAKRNGKNLFLRAGKGAFQPTVHGETFFKKTYQVLKGTTMKPLTKE